MDTALRNTVSTEREQHGTVHDAVRVRLGKMERELRESNGNLTSYVVGLKEDLDNWKTDSRRALAKLTAKQNGDKADFARSLLTTTKDVYTALRGVRGKFDSALLDLTTKMAAVQSTLMIAHTVLKNTQVSDKATIRGDVR